MSAPSDHKRRPPPIAIPELPPSRTALGQNVSTKARSQTEGSGQHPQHFASSSVQHDVRFRTNTPLTSPLEPDELRHTIPKPGPRTSKNRSSAMTTLSGLMDQAHSSPRKSDCGSILSRDGATTGYWPSDRNDRRAATAQAHLEALYKDEVTTRSRIESRTEKNLFKMTGQIPSTPTTGPIDPERVFFRTEDLRAQCRAANGEKHIESDEPTKSPKKKLFGVSLPTFSRITTNDTLPAMPLKAAKILGTKPSGTPRRVGVRPIKPAHVLKMPTKTRRSNTANSLPTKVHNETTPIRAHYSISVHRSRTNGSRSTEKESTPPQQQTMAHSSLESLPPPTPPAKDTPPDCRLPRHSANSLRQEASPKDRRESYGDSLEKGVLPRSALSPSPPKTAIYSKGGVSPTKVWSYTAEDYTKLIGGEALHWPDPKEKEGNEVKEGSHSAPLAAERLDLLQLPLSSRSDDKYYNERLGRRLCPLPPRFYTPSDRSVQLFKDGESPSQNTDTSRMLFAPLTSSLLNENSNIESIELVYQGNMNALESDIPGTEPKDNDGTQTGNKPTQQQRDDTELAVRVKQELFSGEQHQYAPPTNRGLAHQDADMSPSKLTDLPDSITPHPMAEGDSHILCSSTIPTFLYKPHGLHVPMPPAPILRGGHSAVPAGLWPSPHTHKTIEDHFFMTNEHLDVVGKTTYDALDMYTKRQISAMAAKNEQLVIILENHIEGLKSQINLVHEKAEDASTQTQKVDLKLGQLENFLKKEIFAAIAEQSRMTAEMQSGFDELKTTMTHMQQMVEKLSVTKSGPLHSASTASTLMPQTVPPFHSQPALASYYANEIGPDEQPPIPPMQDLSASNNCNSHSDPRANYGTNWQSQVWNGRSTYHGRNKGEASSYAGTSPYHFGSGSQYNNGYVNGYSTYNFSPTPSEQPYVYGQKLAQ